MDSERVILGIDPGTQLLGFGIIRSAGKKAEYVDMGVLDIRKEKDPDATDALAIALCHHYETTSPIKSAKGKGGWERFFFFEAIFQETRRLQGKKKPEPPNSSGDSGSVPRAGIEPARHCCHRILSPARLPIPPSGPVGCKCKVISGNYKILYVKNRYICKL